MTASIRAMSVPGSGWMNQSASSAVIVRIGSMTMTCAPSARAASIVGQRCRLVSLVLVPHRMISFECRISNGSSALAVPLVIFTPAPTVGPQIARTTRVAAQPIPESLGEAHCQQALVAGVAVRHDRLGAVAVDDLVEARSDLAERLFPADLLEPALALGPDTAQRVQHPLVAVHPVEELVDLRAQLALAVRMFGVAAHLQGDRDRPAAVDRDVPTARVGAVVMAASDDDVCRWLVRRCSWTYVRPVSTIQFQQVVVADGVIDLGVGQPNNAILPVDYVRRAAMLQFGESPEFLQYGAEWGDGHHRIALGEYLTEAYGTPVAAEQLFSTNGNSQALEMLCTVMTEPGDVVIVEEPTYFLAFQMFRDHDLEVRGVPIDAEGLIVEAMIDVVADVRAAGKRVAFVYTIPAFQNPTGITMSSQRRRELVAAAADHDVLVVADEVYHLLRFAPGPMPPPMSAYVDEAPVLSIGTFSKILAPGMRLGWVHGSIERLAALADCGLILSGGGLNPVTSTLATAMMRMGWQASTSTGCGPRSRAVRRRWSPRCDEHMPDWVEYDIPTGGYFVWLRLPPGTDGKALRAVANEHGVDVRHGAQFSPTGVVRQPPQAELRLLRRRRHHRGCRRPPRNRFTAKPVRRPDLWCAGRTRRRTRSVRHGVLRK